MRKIIAVLLATAFMLVSQAQNNLYTVVFNQSGANNNFPVMVGATNMADGNNRGVMAGFANIVKGSQRGVQVGMFNTTAGDVTGAQFGIVNYFEQNHQGGLLGIINFVGDDVRGAQIGIVNYFGNSGSGALFGVANYVPEFRGAAFGIINTIGDMEGAQIGAINISRKITGVQIGLLNYASLAYNGVPVGLLSYVRIGGFQAVEVGTNSIYPVTLSLKTGVRRLYTSIITAYNPDFRRNVSFGAGLGTIAEMRRGFFFNPEVNYLFTTGSSNASIYECVPAFGYRIDDKFSVVAAPALSWQNVERGEQLNKAAYPLYTWEIDNRNEIYLGVKIGLRYNFNW